MTLVQRVQTHRLGASSEHERWRTILDAAKANHMDSVILRKCIALAVKTCLRKLEDWPPCSSL
jgi:hypothetical protein